MTKRKESNKKTMKLIQMAEIKTISREMQNPTPETQRRKLEILEKVRKGKSKNKIIQETKVAYDLSDRQAGKLLRDALKDLQEATAEIDINDIKAEYVERIEQLYETSISKNDIKSALKAQDMLNKLNNLYVEKQEVTVTNDVIKFKFDT